VSGLFAPQAFHPMDTSTHGRTFHPIDVSPHGRLTSKTIRPTDAVNINNQQCTGCSAIVGAMLIIASCTLCNTRQTEECVKGSGPPKRLPGERPHRKRSDFTYTAWPRWML